MPTIPKEGEVVGKRVVRYQMPDRATEQAEIVTRWRGGNFEAEANVELRGFPGNMGFKGKHPTSREEAEKVVLDELRRAVEQHRGQILD